MKVVKKKIISIVFLIGLLFAGIGFPELSHALRTDTFTGEINFNVLMDDGSVLPSGREPKALVDYALRRYDYTKNGSIETITTNDYIKKKSVTLSYNGAGNYSHSETDTLTYGMKRFGTPPPDVAWSLSAYLTYYNLRINDAPKYVRSISSISSMHGDYSHYTQKSELYTSNAFDPNTVYSKTITNGMTAIPNPNLTRTEPGAFKYDGGKSASFSEDADSVQFAVSGGSGVGGGLWSDYKYNFSSLASNGKRITFFMKGFQTIENFEDQDGAVLSPPAGFTQGKKTNANADQYTHTMNTLPTSYVTGGNMYVLEGWYQGPVKPGTLQTSNPPSITVDYTQSKSIQDFDEEGEIHVVYKKSFVVNEKYVDDSDASINGGAWDTVIPIAQNSTFNGSPAATKTDSSSVDWEYVGWKIGSGGAVNTAPVTIASVTGNEDIYYIYKRSKTTATLDLTPTPKIVNNNSNVSWTSRLTNTGSAPLKDLILKATSNWSSSLEEPAKVTVTPAGGIAQDFTVNPGDWATGVNLTGMTIPNGGVNNYADITFTTKTTANNAVNQVLPAEIEVSGNIPTPVTAENFVRINDLDEPNLEPMGNAGLINIPDFRFGEVEVKPFAHTKGLDASLYQPGYDPYIRFIDMESTGGWSLTAKLDQFKSGTKTLPTTTTIKLKNGVLMEVQNYDKHNETLNYVDLAGSVSIPSDNNSVAFTNGTNRGVYQLEYDSNGVELELMAHSGIAGLSYQADMEWTLTTAP